MSGRRGDHVASALGVPGGAQISLVDREVGILDIGRHDSGVSDEHACDSEMP